ncbi:ATP-binding protein [uncultured Phocaeicola sp.]|jgi:signal transduction histidine kinase/CheY-like chemotaxis protein|uniref:ATP-binding response regulator n=1 Tax=uncultured Phocaeicola sp. TaxID=990718 RepID=UPI00258B8CEF|nr:ATP-binding protein [uncultured Phocaeicola sp.]
MLPSILLTVVALFFVIKWWLETKKTKNLSKEVVVKESELSLNKDFSDAILRNIDAYIVLANRNFLVEKTNYYSLNDEADDGVFHRVGELLRCKNALDSGACGTHENCKYCPVRASIEKCFREKNGFSQLEAPMRLYLSNDTGNYVDCIVSVSGAYMLLDGDEKVLLTVRDITRLKKIQEELEVARQVAEVAGEQKTAFLANMSHEIRTPLNAIVGFAGLLANASEAERNSYVEIIKGNTNMLLQLVNDILDMSKIEAGTLEFIYSDTDVNQIMRELEGIFRLRLEEADSPVRIVFEPCLPVCFIHTEKNRVSQVLSNFLSNAFKYTKEGTITLGYKVREDDIYFYVQDTGTGIPAENVDKVFERFMKLDAKKQGTGLGLSISQTIIKKLGGEIGVFSEYGKGSTFWFTLPVKPFDFLPLQRTEDDSESVGVDEAAYGEGAVRRTILIAEDMDDNYLLYKIYLEKQYDLIRAVNGEEAIAKYLECNPAIILMDIGMPVVDGYQATDAIRQLSSDIPIVAVTAFAYDEDRRKVMSRGFNGYLSKPLNKDELFRILHKMGV